MGVSSPTTGWGSVPRLVLSLLVPVTVITVSRSLRGSHGGNDDNDGKCELIGTFSLITQAFLGLLCLSSLLVKRFYEYPMRRSWPVWLFDVLKQLIGALGVHIFNVLLAIVKTTKNPSVMTTDGDDEDLGDPCDWYFLNIVFDCTIGVFVLYHVFKVANRVCKKYLHITHIELGQYGPDERNPSFRAFLKQLTVYFTSLMVTKVILFGVMECFETQLLWFTSNVLLVWLDVYPDELEIFIVIFVVPIVMNCLQLILIDNFIQSQEVYRYNDRAHHSQRRHGNAEDEDEHQKTLLHGSGSGSEGEGADNYGTFA